MKILGIILLALSACTTNQPNVNPTPTPVATATPVSTATPVPSTSPSPSATPQANWWKTPNGVDLRACDSQIENQQTPNCTAFAVVSTLSNMVCKKDRLSEHHAWSFYEEYSVDAAANNVPGKKITTWDMWTESASKPKPGYLEAAKNMLTGLRYIDESDDIKKSLEILDSGRPVYIGLSVNQDMASCYSNIRASAKQTTGGHSVVIVGYGLDAKLSGGGYWIIKNSWGTDCADGGYQYLEFGFANNKNAYLYMYEPLGFK